MSKITKKEYNRLKAELQAQINKINLKLDILDKWENDANIGYNSMTPEFRDKIEKIGNYWNNLHDKQRELEKELKYLDDKWNRRNWTESEWNSWELVTSNID
jgi:uncharacterized membrane protein YgaE (UPF0421/DUF939 family)